MKNRKLFVLLLVLVMLFSLTGCGASSKVEMNAVDSGMAMAPESAVSNRLDVNKGGFAAEEAPSKEIYDSETTSKEETTSVALPENRKLIQTFRITAETENLDGVLSQLNAYISQLSGYIEGQDVYHGSAYSGRRYRNAELTIRIPADKAEGFINQVSELSNVVSSNKTVEDITLKYVSTESRMKALQTEEQRLLELLGKAETMEDLLTIERYLTDVRYELEAVTSSLRVYDNRVDYATIYLSVSEVKEYTVVTEPETMWERIRAGFKETLEDMGESLEDFFVFLAVNIPYIILWGALIAVVIVVWRIRKKKKAQKKAADNPQP